ncbi:MAG TPA: hypothetical protein VNA20_18705 [Frankiaceae bacterium]|nr:hypothetical protein [Frankiaceae bacterium]
MNDFDALLPHRRPAPPLPDRGGPAAVVRAAASRRRRRRCATSGVAGTVVATVVLLATVLPEPPKHGLTVTEDASPTATPEPRVTSPAASPSGSRSGPATALPSLPAPVGTTHPPAPRRPVPSGAAALPTPTRTATTTPDPFWVYTRVDRSPVPDDGSSSCSIESADHDPTQLVCLRVDAPASLRSGASAVLTTRTCARNGDVTLRFAGDTEVVVQISDTDGGAPHYESRVRPTGIGPHEIVVRNATCLRHDFHWDGKDDRGAPLAPGVYRVFADVDATTPVAGTQPADLTVTPAESPSTNGE